MQALLLPQNILNIDIIWWLTAGVMVVGGLLLLSASIVPEAPAGEQHYWRKVGKHLLRDVAIAFIVAGLVTLVYGNILDFRRMSDAVSLMIGDNVPPEIWDTTKTEIYQRAVIRENLEIRINIQTDTSLPSCQALLKAEISYDLYGLKPEPFPFTVKQELDYFNMHNEKMNLPRFDSVTVDNKMYKGEELNALIKEGLLTLPPVTVQPWHKGEAVHIVTERVEIINVPGAYSNVLSQLTKGVKLYIEAPPEIEYRLKEWFDRGGQEFQVAGKYNFLHSIVLPGQSISLQFRRSSDKPVTSSLKPSVSPRPLRPVRH